MAEIIALLLVVLLITLSMGLWVSLSLFVTGAVLMTTFMGHLPVLKIVAQSVWNMVTTPEILALPLFIFMAEILFRTRLSESLFRGVSPWTERLPGKLVHINVIACTLFAAVSGSSAATAATVGRITLKDLTDRGYNKDLCMGSLAGSGTLGFLIPPSTAMIIYALLANVSVLQMFAAGILPGLLLAFSFSAYLAVRALFNPSLTPSTGEVSGWAERLYSLVHLGPILALILCVLGSMYGGIATPTEAAALGVFGALGIAFVQRSLTREGFAAACIGTVTTTSMIGMIIGAAAFLSVGFAYLRVPEGAAVMIASLDLSPLGLIFLLVVFYSILGMFLDGVSMTVMTLPITLPLVLHAGFDPVWFGVVLVLVIEMAQITPPVGFNLFVIQGLTGESISRIAIAAFPFFIIMFCMAMFLTFFPQIALVVPALLGFR